MYLASCKAFCVPIRTHSSITYTCVHFSLKLHRNWKQTETGNKATVMTIIGADITVCS